MLNINATPAEVARGCRFAERFVDPIAVAKNRGTVVGTVPIIPGKGAYFNGVAGNMISYPVTSILNKAVVNFVIEFVPYFAYDDGVIHEFFDTTGGADRVFFAKLINGNIYLSFGATGSIFTVVPATYLPYWNGSKRNVITMTILSGSAALYLNGGLIGAFAGAVSGVNPAQLFIGATNAGINPFDGYISSWKIFTGNTSADLLSAQEAMNYYRQDV